MEKDIGGIRAGFLEVILTNFINQQFESGSVIDLGLKGH